MTASIDPGRAHAAQLAWFLSRTGQKIPWPREEDEGMLLATKAKGIYKPAGSDLALSIRIAQNGPYPNLPELRADGSWTVRYHEERPSGKGTPAANDGLANCMARQQPIGVMLQLQRKPQALYSVLGLGQVTAYAHGIFVIEGPWSPEEASAAQPLPPEPAGAHDALADARDRILAEVVRRQGQGKFRQALLDAYGGRCAVSGCAILHVLEAAHIVPYRGRHSNSPRNGLLLRADFHTLFDLGLLSLCPVSLTVQIAPGIADEYGQYSGQPICLPQSPEDHPDPDLIRIRQSLFDKSG